MNTITKTVVLIGLCLFVSMVSAQEEQQTDSIPANKTIDFTVKAKIEQLKKLKETIAEEEREFLKLEVESINQRLDEGILTIEEANTLKREAAEKRALNIENRIAIVDNRIALLERNQDDGLNYNRENGEGFVISIGDDDDEDFTIINFKKKRKPKKYDKRTQTDLVFALGVNNALIDGEKLGDTYSVMGSGYVELGLAWKTRLFKESNAVRLKYGFSFQWNKFTPKNDRYFVQDGNTTTLEAFPGELKESEFRVTNLVFPIHFEFGPSKKIERKNYFRYTTNKQFKFGVGGYAGFNIGTQQKLRFKEDGDRVKQKIKRNYNTSDFIYGLSAYVGIDEISLYMKYDLNTVFKNQAVDQNNISLGLRFDFD
ncbi:hypothetical protein AB9K26_04340 [Psychroserpens sp. XS_ASV72]|uniref:hypothetical protein n=1 Tax=Psychroserpens sp. XS_ASV72 TaxID=3241293 RepID=UPI00351949CF